MLPGRTTQLENLNAVSAGHLQRIVGLMCRDQESRLPGSFGILIVDSTPVRADMALVTDTHLVWSSADRLCGLLGRAAADGLLAPALSAEARGWLGGLARGARTVALSGGPARRHQETVHGMLGDACRLALAAWEPVRGLADALERALVGLMLCVRQARARWLKKMVPRAGEKFLGAADPDAAIIMKGGRAPVLGCHPQIVTGVCGMVATVVVDQGCLSDAASLRAAVGMAVEATGVTPSAVSTDDGYTSRANLKWIRDGLGAGLLQRRQGAAPDAARRVGRRRPPRAAARPGALRGRHLHAEAGPPPRAGACVGEGRVRAELLCKVIAYDLMLPYKREVRAHGRRRPDRTACAFRPEATGGA